MVAMLGAEHGRPLGHPPDGEARRRRPRPPCACVSVVMMAVAAAGRRRRPGRGGPTSPGIPALDGGHGQGDPDQPGLADEDLRRRPPEPLAHQRAHPLGVGRAPAAPVAALAFPLERTTAAARPPRMSRWARLSRTRSRGRRPPKRSAATASPASRSSTERPTSAPPRSAAAGPGASPRAAWPTAHTISSRRPRTRRAMWPLLRSRRCRCRRKRRRSARRKFRRV